MSEVISRTVAKQGGVYLPDGTKAGEVEVETIVYDNGIKDAVVRVPEIVVKALHEESEAG